MEIFLLQLRFYVKSNLAILRAQKLQFGHLIDPEFQVKMAVLEATKLPNLISRKIWVAEISLTFHIVNPHMKSSGNTARKKEKILTSEWKRPHVSNLTAKSKGSAASPFSTFRLQFGSWAWPLTYMTPWKLGSATSTVTETPSAKQLTTMSGRGKSLGGGIGFGIGTEKMEND